MKILILAPIERKITSQITSARPRIIFDLITGLKKRGHKITVLGTADSKILGVKIIPVIKKGFYEISSEYENPFYAWTSFLVKQAKMAEKIAGKFDVVHNHAKPEFINLLSNIKKPMLTTLHLPINKELDDVLSFFPKSKIICGSKAAKALANKSKIHKIIHLGIDTNLYKFSEKKGDYLLWIGRLSKAKDKRGKFMDPKGVKWAIKLAKTTNSKLIMAGNVEDSEFFEKEVKPHLNKKIKWVGGVSFEQPLSKQQVAKLMQKAKVFLMTTQLHETFGLVMAEAQSCGTPVIAFKKGAIPEVVKHGKTGFVVRPNNLIELKKALKKIDTIRPQNCRKWIESHFSLEKMVSNYERTYKSVAKK